MQSWSTTLSSTHYLSYIIQLSGRGFSQSYSDWTSVTQLCCVSINHATTRQNSRHVRGPWTQHEQMFQLLLFLPDQLWVQLLWKPLLTFHKLKTHSFALCVCVFLFLGQWRTLSCPLCCWVLMFLLALGLYGSEHHLTSFQAVLVEVYRLTCTVHRFSDQRFSDVKSLAP